MTEKSESIMTEAESIMTESLLNGKIGDYHSFSRAIMYINKPCKKKGLGSTLPGSCHAKSETY